MSEQQAALGFEGWSFCVCGERGGERYVAGEPCAANLRGVVRPAGRLLGAPKQRLGAQRVGARGRGWARGAMLPGPVVASRLVWQGVCDGECTRGVMEQDDEDVCGGCWHWPGGC